MSVITTIEDLRVLAERRVPRMFYDYADSGSWTEGTYRANTDDFLEVDVAFHSLILEASTNEMIVALTESVVSVMRGRTEFGLQPARLSDKSVHHHLDLARAIADGDAGHAAELSRALLVEVDAQAY